MIEVQNKYLAQLEEDERIKKEEALQKGDDLDSEDDDLLFKNHNRENAFTAFDDTEEEDSDEYSEEDSEEESEEEGDVDTIVDKLGNTHIRN